MNELKIFEEAQDQWPEDEAGFAAEHAIELFNMEGRDYCQQWIIKERLYWTKVFGETDERNAGSELYMKRFVDRFNAIAFPIIGIAM